MLYKLSPIQKHQETNLTLSLKWSRSTQGYHLKQKAPGYRHTTTRYKFWQHFKAFIIPIILYQFQKDPFCLIILYDILFYFIHVYIAQGQEETTLGNIFFWWKQKGLLTLITGCMFQKIALPSDFMHIFHDFIHVHSSWAGADNTLGPKCWCQQEGFITLVICCKFKKISSTSDFIHISSWFNKCI